MKIVFLNTWKAKNSAELTKFVEQNYEDTDVFCLQEAHIPTQNVFDKFLEGYKKVTDHKFVSEADDFVQVTYLRQDLNIVSTGSLFMNEKECGIGLFVQLTVGNKNLYICNFHGLARPFDKLDSPEREKISKGLANFFKNKDGAIVIGGDFNLLPNTNSIRVFEESGFRNLIKDYSIETTRNHFAWDLYPDNKQLFADYVFVDKNIHIKSFTVANNEASDHLPLVLDIDI